MRRASGWSVTLVFMADRMAGISWQADHKLEPQSWKG